MRAELSPEPETLTGGGIRTRSVSFCYAHRAGDRFRVHRCCNAVGPDPKAGLGPSQGGAELPKAKRGNSVCGQPVRAPVPRSWGGVHPASSATSVVDVLLGEPRATPANAQPEPEQRREKTPRRTLAIFHVFSWHFVVTMIRTRDLATGIACSRRVGTSACWQKSSYPPTYRRFPAWSRWSTMDGTNSVRCGTKCFTAHRISCSTCFTAWPSFTESVPSVDIQPM